MIQDVNDQLSAGASDVGGFLGRLSGKMAQFTGARRAGFWSLDEERGVLDLEPEPHGFSGEAWRGLRGIPSRSNGVRAVDRVVFGDDLVSVCAGDRPRQRRPPFDLESLDAADAIAVSWRAGNRCLGMVAAFDSMTGGFTETDAWALRFAGAAAGMVRDHGRARSEVAEKTAEAATYREDAARMQELEEIKGQFLNLASHELRGPLTLLGGYIDMMREGAISRPQIEKILPVMSGRIAHMNWLVNGMLETARLESGGLELDRRRLDLRQVVADTLSSMAPLASSRHRLLRRIPDHEIPVNADRGRLETILVNLIDNAIKYSPDGGTVTSVVAARDGRGHVVVGDRGIGVPQGSEKRLFSRFGRLLTPAQRHISGTGLGLYLSRELAQRHGGDLTFRHRPSGGSVFTLALPLAD